MHATVSLLGLPGSGKQRLKQALVEQLGCKPENIHPSSDISLSDRSEDFDQTWCVIDVRSGLQSNHDPLAVKQLESLVSAADGVVFNFMEASELDDQLFWGRWVKQRYPDKPIMRFLNRQIPKGWCGFEVVADKTEKPAAFSALAASDKALQSFKFDVGRVCLDHLLMGLDNSRQNLGMQIWRVQAVVDTVEYENRVAVEATPFRWDTFAAIPEAESGWIKIEGIDLNEAWLEEIIQASMLVS